MKSINTIKKVSLATLLTFVFSFSSVFAQNDTMYIMKAGVVVGQYNVDTEIDSVIFYKPTQGSPTTVTDYDGNVYNTVTIGSQVWMAENLKTTHYADGTPILLVTGNSNWDTLTAASKAYCYYDDDSATNASTYGALYTWAAAMNGAPSDTNNPSGVQGVCPTGWHLPSYAEWIQLEDYLADNGYNYDGTTGGGEEKIAKALADSSGWNSSSNTGAVGNTDFPAYRNKSGFTALPGGLRSIDGASYLIGENGFWCSATEMNASSIWDCIMYYDVSYVDMGGDSKENGFSVRCLRD